MNTNVSITDLALFPYSKDYFEMVKSAYMLELLDIYLENSLYNPEEFPCNEQLYLIESEEVSNSGIIERFITMIKKMWNNFIGFFKNIGNRIAGTEQSYQQQFSKKDGEEPIGTVDSVLRAMVKKKDHQWTSKEIDDFINTNKSGSLRKWANLKITVTDPDIQSLNFYPGVDKDHKLAFQHILTFMISREQNESVSINDLIEEAPEIESRIGKLFGNGSKKVATVSGGLIALSQIPNILSKVSRFIKQKNIEGLKKQYDELVANQTDIRNTKIELLNRRRNGDLSQDQIKAINDQIAALDEEVRRNKDESNALKRDIKSTENELKNPIKIGGKMIKSIPGAIAALVPLILGIVGLTLSGGLALTDFGLNFLGSIGRGVVDSLRSVIS